MKLRRSFAISVTLLACAFLAFAASPPPIASSFYGSISAAGRSVPDGSAVSAWVNGTQLAQGTTFTADGASAFVLDVPGDIPDTAAIEGAQPGQTIVFKVAGATANQTTAWQMGSFSRQDLTVPTGADLKVTIDDGVSGAFPKESLIYTITVENHGSIDATGVSLKSTLPAVTTLVSAEGGTVSSGVVTWPVFALAAGASTVRTVTVQVNTTLPQGTDSIIHTVQVSHDGAQGIDPNPDDNTASDTDLLRVPPDFAITAADLTVTPAHPTAGQTVNVGLTVHNPGFVNGTALVVLYDGRPGSGTLVGSQMVTVPAGGTAPVSTTFVATASTVVVSAVVDPNNDVVEVDETNNTAQKFLVNVPDLAVDVDNVSITPASPRAGDPAKVKVTVRNAGLVTASNVPVTVYDGEPEFGGAPVYSGTIPSIPVAGNQTVSFDWAATEGVHLLTAVDDPANAILEISEDNNRVEKQVVVSRAAGPDFTVGSIDLSGFQQSPSTLVASGTIRATVQNIGTAASSQAFTVRLFEDRDGDGTFTPGDRELARQTLPAGLGAGSSVVASFAVNAGLEFLHPVLWVEADPANEVAELREDNNRSAVFANCETAVTPSLLPIKEKWFIPGIEAESAPVVVQLTDDNGDGRIDSRDVPDVVFHTETAAGVAEITARSGLDGTEIWSFPFTAVNPVAGRLAHVAAADLDGDGVAEIVGIQTNGRLVCLDHTGKVVWVSDQIEGPATGWAGGATIGDLDGDGVPEIAVGRTVLSNTGHKIAVGAATRGQNYNYYAALGYPLPPGIDQAHSIIADLDLDGRAELIAGDTVYRLQNGQLNTVWSYTVPDNLMRDGFTAVANLDGDPYPEIVYVSSGFVMIFNHDGTVRVPYRRLINLSVFTPTTYWAGAPTIADLDGDGIPEILVAGDTELVALRSSLGTYWRKPVDDLGSVTGVSVFDLDGDGLPEVLYQDQSNFYILDGRTGATKYVQANISKTAMEYPVVADLDNDGQADILVPSNKGFDGNVLTQGLHALTGSGWRSTRPIWNQYSYHVTNVQLDGTVPSPETPSWQAQNTYRANESLPPQARRVPNATIGLPRVAAPTTSGVPVTLRVGNGGRAALRSGVRVQLFPGDPSTTSPVGTGQTTKALAPGDYQDVVVLWTQPGPAGAAAVAVVDPQRQVDECDETDNSVAFTVTESVFPDLAVPSNGVTASASPVAGQKVTINVQVTNSGSATAAASVVRLYDGPPSLGVVAGEAPLGALNPGQSTTVPVIWDAAAGAGSHVIYAVADADDTVVELSEANNQGFTSVTLAEPAKPDLAVEALRIVPATATAGTPVTLSVDVLNRGLSLPGSFAVSFKVNNAQVASITVPGPLNRGQKTTIDFTLDTLSLNGHLLIEGRADPANAIAEQNESNNALTGYLDIQGSGLVATAKTDKVSYGSNQTVAITVNAQNNNSTAKAATLRVTIQDGAGAVVATVASQPVSLNPGASAFNLSWPTGATPAGPYVAVADLLGGGTVLARGTAGFSITQDRLASAQLFTDRSEYEPDQTVALTGRARNTGVNASLSNLVATLQIRNPGGTVVWTATQTIPLLSAGAEAAVNANWPVANAAPGVYTASLDLREQGGITPQLAYAATQFTVLDSSQTGTGLTGSLTVSPTPAGVGTILLARFTTRNGGNVAIPGLRLRLRLVQLSDGADALIQEMAWPLNQGEQKSGAVGLPTAGLAEGEYQVKLDAVLPAKTPNLASQDLLLVRGVSIRDAKVQEGDGGTTPALFEVSLSSPSLVPVTVDYATADGTATAGSDYDAASGTLTFAPGETTKTIAVQVHGDTAPEGDEVFLVSLSNPVGVELADAQATGEIDDEEGCGSPNLLVNPGAEAGALETDLPAWTPRAGLWTRRPADPMALDGAASFATSAGDPAELVQEVDLARFADAIDHASLMLAVEGFVRSNAGADPAKGRVIVEYTDASGSNVLDSYDSGELASPEAWRAVSDSRTVPAGTRRARVRLLATRPGGGEVFFDRLGLRSLGVPVLTAEDAQVAEGTSGTAPLRFRASVSCVRSGGLTVNYTTQDGTARAGTDYDPASGTLTFSPGALAQTVDVAVHGDTTDEPDETLKMVFSGGSDVVVLTPQVTGTILNDDAPVTLSIGDASVTEGDSGTVDAIFPVTLSNESGQEVRVNYATASGTATADADFVTASGTVIFPPGTTSQTITVQVKGDRLNEPAESFFVRLSSPLHATIADGEGEGQIQDDDPVLIAVSDVRVTETDSGTAPATFTVTLSVPSVFPVTVQYATADGTALAPADYTAASGTLTFAPGTTSQTVAVPVVGELVKEPEEIFFVRLANPTNAMLGRPEGVCTIIDNDGVLVSVGDLVIKEGDTNVTAAFQIKLSKSFNQPITVQYTTQDGSALAGADYVGTSGSVTFPAGTTLQTVNVTVLPDTLDEPVEDFSLRALSANNGAVLFKPVGVATLTDNDAWVLNGPFTSSERVPGCLSLSPPTWNGYNDTSAWRRTKIDLGYSFDQTYRVLLGGAGGMVYMLQNVGLSAVGGGYGGLGNTGIIPAMGLEMDFVSNGYIPDPPYDHLAIDLNGAQTHNGAPPVQASTTSTEIDDGREHILRVVWNASAKAFTAYFDGSERLVFERDLIQSIFGGTSSVYYGMTSGDDQTLNYFCPTAECFGRSDSPSISVGNVRVLEGSSGTTNLWFPVTLSCPSDRTVTVSDTTADGSATAGEDYLSASGTVTFLPGETAHDVAVTVLGDTKFEPDEQLELRLANPTNGTLRYSSAVGTILTDDIAVSSPPDVTVIEGNSPTTSISLTVTRQGSLTGTTTTVTYATANGTATAGSDYVAVSGTLTFQPGETTKTILLQIKGDTLRENDETFFLRLTSAAGAQIVDNETAVTILDDDDCPTANLVQNGGGEQLVNGELPGWEEVQGTLWTHTTQSSGSLVFPPPYEGSYLIYPGTPTIPAELRQDVDVSSFAQPIDTGIQRFFFEAFVRSWPENPPDTTHIVLEYRDATNTQVLGSFDSGVLASTAGWQRLTDLRKAPVGSRVIRIRLLGERKYLGDAYTDAYFDAISLIALGTPSLSVGDVTVVEGSSGTRNATFPVQLSCASALPVQVSYLTSDDTATAPSDYQATVGTLVFQPGEVTKSVAVPVVGDTRTEGNETFFLNLASSVNAGIADAQGQATIQDDEVSLSVAGVSVVEGNSGTTPALLKVTLSAASDQIVTVDYATDAETATRDLDYVHAAGTLTFNPGETTKTVQVDIIGDTTPEPDEDIHFLITNPVNAYLAAGMATIKIINDDLGLAISDASVIEGNSGTTNAIFNVKLNAASSVNVTVHYATRDGSATAGPDYTSTSGTLTFAPGETAKTITVAVKGDTVQESGETFFIDLSSPTNASITDGEGQGVIADDDGCPGPNLLANASGEQPLVNGEIPSWTEAVGTAWDTRSGVPTGAFDGANVFFAGAVTDAELRQDVDLSGYAAFIDAGIQRFVFQGYIRSATESPSDPGRIVVEFLDAGKNVLAAEDSGEIVSTAVWQSVSVLRPAPEGTRFARVRLIGRRVSPGNLDAYFDALSLRSLDTPVASVANISIQEGDTQNVTGTFTVNLTCATAKTVTIDYATADGTATAPGDYGAVAGTLRFNPGQTSLPVDVTVVGDFLNEIRETFFLNLSHWVNAAVVVPQATATIRDADPGAPPVPGTDVTYTVDADFDRGIPTAVNHDDPNHDQLQVSAHGGSLPYLWVAESAKGMIVKIDTRTGDILGEYSTNPDQGTSAPDPSRTTVALDGSVWVGNRGDGSVLHVGLPELGQCIDRNGNGVIDTSSGFGDVLSWPGTANLTGGVSQAQDECILHFVKVSPSIVRHVSVDRDNNVWVSGWGGTNPQVFNLINGDTGKIMRTEGPFPCGGYGGFVDANGIVWSSSNSGAPLRWDPSVVPPTAQSLRCVAGVSPYGIAIDSQGNMWGTDYSSTKVWKVSPDGNTISGPYLRSSSNSQGLAVDGNDHVWVSSSTYASGTVVGHFLPSGKFLGNVTNVPVGSTGIAVDSAGKIWAVNLQASNAVRIDPTKGPIGSDGVTPLGQVDLTVPIPGANPYNYSDMTGFVALRSTAASGRWLVIQDAGTTGAAWGMLRWNQEPQGQIPGGGGIVVEARAADTVPALGSKAYLAVGNGVPFVLQGRYLQVRATLKRGTGGVSPVLSDLRVQTAQDGVLSVGDVTVTEGDSGTADAVFTVSLEQPVNRDVQVSYSTADGTALAGQDYTAVSGTVTIPFGTRSVQIHVPVAGDTVSEPDEQLFLNLSSPLHATIARAQGVGTILDNDRKPVLAATKTDSLAVDADGDGKAGPGDTLRYDIQIRNTGSAPAGNVVLADDPPAGTTLVAGSVAASQGTVQSEAPVRVAIGEIAPNGSATVSFQVTVSSSLPETVSQIENQARITSDGLADLLTDDPDTAPVGDPTVTPVVNRPRLVARKVASLASDNDGDGVPSPGDVIGYEVTLENQGGRTASQVVFRDLIPANTSVAPGSVTTTQGSVTSEDPVEVAVGSLSLGGQVKVGFRVKVDDPIPVDVTAVSNQGIVLSAELPAVLTDDPALAGDADPTVTAITAAPRLAAEKTDRLAVDADGNGVPSPGDTIEYTVKILNQGNTSALGVSLNDPIPANTRVVPGSVHSTQGAVTSESPVGVDVGEIQGGGRSVTVTFQVTIDNPLAAGVSRISNQGTVSSRNQDDVLTDDPKADGPADPTVTAVTAAPVLTATKRDTLLTDADGNGLASPGDTVIYQISISNTGNTAATDVALSDAIPAHTALVPGSVRTSQGTVTEGDPIQVAIGQIPAQGSADVSFQVVIDAAFPADQTEIGNQGQVSSHELPALLTDDPDTPDAADPTRTDVVIPATISIADVTVSESAGRANFTLTLSRPSNHEVAVTYATQDGTALSGLDYVGAGGIATFAPGSTARTVSVEIVGDTLQEPAETFQVRLSNPVAGTIARGEATGTILDDDPPPAITIDGVTVEEGDAGTVDAVFNVHLSAPSGQEIRVDFSTANGTAQAPGDYLAQSGTVVFPAGTTSQPVVIQVVGDQIAEGDESFLVHLSQSVNATIAVAEAAGTIIDDEKPQLSIGDVSVQEGDSGTTDAAFPIHLSAAGAQTVTVDFTTSPGTATENVDYQATSGTVTFNPNETDKTVVVKVDGDTVLEPDETFRVTLANPVRATLDKATGTGTILNDEKCLGANMVVNPGAEAHLVSGQIPGWTQVEGTQWTARLGPPSPYEGNYTFWSNSAQFGELRQDVDVSALAAQIDGGQQGFAFRAHLRSSDEVPPDTARVVVEYRDAGNVVPLQVFDSGELASVLGWQEIADARSAPVGTRWIRIRLLASRYNAGTTDSFFDAVSLQPQGAATLTVDDVSVYEGSSGQRDAVFLLSLSCPLASDLRVGYSTADGTATAGSDYLATSGTVVLPALSQSGEVHVPVLGDALDEPDETFFLNLGLVSPPPFVALQDGSGTGTILNDDYCQKSPGYWKNHQTLWPVTELQMGGLWYYQAQILSFLSYNGSDASLILAHHLMATKLNLARGSDPAKGAPAPSILPAVSQSDLFLAAHPPGSNPGGTDRDLALSLKNVLDAYNNACP
jgi:uncharacterized repeat protein (TIGR01451 family)